MRRAKRIFKEKDRPADEDDGVVTAFRDGEVTLRENRRTEGYTESLTKNNYQGIRKGDLVIHSMDAFAGAIGVSDSDGQASPVYVVCRPENEDEVDVHFYKYLLRHMAWSGYIESLARGIRERSSDFRYSEFANQFLPVPPLQEQRAIAKELNERIARIDHYIAKKRDLIDLLETQRRAVINRAVTRGLDDGVEMKDSESRFFPSIPSHWEETQLKHLCHDIADGPHHSPNYVDDGIPFLSVRNVKVNGWDFDDLVYIDEEDYEAFCDRVVPGYGDVLYTKGGTTGIAKAVDFDQRFQVWVHLAVLKVREDLVDPFFLAHMLNSRGCYDQSQLYTRGAANQDLGLTRMARIDLLRPPLEEQKQIVNHIDERTSEIDDAIGQAERQIELMEQYRTSLVAEVVTGTVDVRDTVVAWNIVTRMIPF
jgi:type I restriction enzyme S subunit